MPSPTAIPLTPTTMVPSDPMDATLPEMAPTPAAAGSVTSQASTIRLAVRHRTDASRWPTPEPTTPPEQTWVVESGKPRREETRMTSAELV